MFYGILLAVFLACGGLLWLLLRSSSQRGKIEEQAKQNEKVLDNVEKAKVTRSRLFTDPDYARRVRERYTRKK